MLNLFVLPTLSPKAWRFLGPRSHGSGLPVNPPRPQVRLRIRAASRAFSCPSANAEAPWPDRIEQLLGGQGLRISMVGGGSPAGPGVHAGPDMASGCLAPRGGGGFLLWGGDRRMRALLALAPQSARINNAASMPRSAHLDLEGARNPAPHSQGIIPWSFEPARHLSPPAAFRVPTAQSGSPAARFLSGNSPPLLDGVRPRCGAHVGWADPAYRRTACSGRRWRRHNSCRF